MHTSQQSSEVVAAAAVANSDTPEVGAADTASAMPVLVFVLAAVAVTSVFDPRYTACKYQNWVMPTASLSANSCRQYFLLSATLLGIQYSMRDLI